MDPQKQKTWCRFWLLFRAFWRGLPKRPPDPPKSRICDDFSQVFCLFSKIFCQVLHIRRLCRYAGFADMHVLQIRRFCRSRVPALVPASASAAIADANCIGVRRWPAAGVFNIYYIYTHISPPPSHPPIYLVWVWHRFARRTKSGSPI